ncbi:MAG TPA: hypothetical protein VNZ55_11360, partial [Thermomicrobiales bacterium]|nr:hypothetical protein [Thermomicrobiales bacterium]
GNVLVKPAGDLTLRDDAGAVVFTAPVAMGSVYAGMTVPLSVRLASSLPSGDYQLSVNLTDEATGATASLQRDSFAISTSNEPETSFVLSGSVTLKPDANDPAYADVAVQITNQGEAVADSEVVMDVMKDGELVEAFPLAPSLSLPQGETSVNQRYVPPSGWETGSWSFVVRLKLVDQGGAATTLATLDTIPPIEVEVQK